MAQAKLVVNGGVIIIANGASLIIDNPDNTAITYNGTGYIQSEGDANKLIWSIGAGNGNTFLIPFGNAAYNFPFQFNATSGTAANGQIISSTYNTPTWKNNNYLSPGVTSVHKNGTDNSIKIIDRFSQIKAQEVKKIYPQVILKHADFIPNVYEVTNKLTKINDGYLLSFNTTHNLSKIAKKLQVLAEGNVMQPFDIVSIPSVNEVVINGTEIKGEKVFVYGEEVNDFRTVDYEGLTTLNISATQEISKLIKKQAAMIENLEKRLAALESKPLQRMVGIK